MYTLTYFNNEKQLLFFRGRKKPDLEVSRKRVFYRKNVYVDVFIITTQRKATTLALHWQGLITSC